MSTVAGGQGNIITNGLVLRLDAANPRSYQSGSLIWNDLSGYNNHGTLISGAFWTGSNNGAIVFDGVDDYVQFTSTYAGTICVWGIADVGSTSGLQAVVGVTATGDGSLRLLGGSFRGGTVSGQAGTADINDYQSGSLSQFMINGVANLPTDYQGFYIVPNSRTLNQNFFIGALGNRAMSTISHTFAGRAYKGKIFQVLIYNRQLTYLELQQNFNATRARFGI